LAIISWTRQLPPSSKPPNGKIGDGKVFVSSIEEAVRIRTEEKGEAAV